MDKVDTITGDVSITIDDVNVIFVDILVSLKSGDSFVEDRMENCVFLLKGN